MDQRKIYITNALPYANGKLHLGHLVGFIQADIWKRYLRLEGHECIHICGSDVHGTPIMLNAKKSNVSIQDLWMSYMQQHLGILKKFEIEFDFWGHTELKEHYEFVQEFFLFLKERELIYSKKILQSFDVQENMCLNDRMIIGSCPYCHATEQYGDACEICSRTYHSQELINPVSTLSGNVPSVQENTSLFFRLSHFQHFVKVNSMSYLDDLSSKYMSSWFAKELSDWDISRFANYFGIPIPEYPEMSFYVWFDAILAYISFCRDKALMIWDQNSPYEIYQFIGKDILYFHSLFWIALLQARGLKLPTKLIVNGFLTVNEKKISKSKNPLLDADSYLDNYSQDVYRFFVALRSSGEMKDIHFYEEDMVNYFNNIIVGKVVNLASRSSTLLETYFNNLIIDDFRNLEEEYQKVIDSSYEDILKSYEILDFSQVVQTIVTVSDKANYLFNKYEPWKMVKDDPETVHIICSITMNAFSHLVLWLYPIVPTLCEQAFQYLDLTLPKNWTKPLKKLGKRYLKDFKKIVNKA